MAILARLATLAIFFCVTAAILHLLIGDPRRLYAEGRSEKIAQLHKWGSKISVVAIGNSRIEEGFDPAVFDATFAGKSNSFDLGLPGGGDSEQRFTGQEALRTLEASKTQSPRLLLLELNAGINFPPEDVLHPRAINIYDANTIRFSYQFSGDEISLPRKLGRSAFALIAGAAHYANAGMLSAMIFRGDSADNPEAALAATHGQRITPASRQDLLDRDNMLSMYSSPAAPTPEPVPPGNYQLLTDIVNGAGGSMSTPVQFVYVVTPGLTDLGSSAIYPDEIQGPNGAVPIINLARPDLYPQLYQRDNWRNANHVNAAGAAVFTRLLAEQLNAWLRQHTPK